MPSSSKLYFPTIFLADESPKTPNIIELIHLSYSFYYNEITTLGPSWRSSFAEDLASLSLQDGPRSGIIISQPASQPANQSF